MSYRRLSLTLSDLNSLQQSPILKPKCKPLRILSNMVSTTTSSSAGQSKRMKLVDSFCQDEMPHRRNEFSVPLSFISFEDKSSPQKENYSPRKSPLIVHHTLVGTKENWKTACREIFHVTRRPIVAVDARNHGESPHINEMSYSSMAKDVQLFVNQLDSQKFCYVGHNMGGRVGLLLAMLHPELFEKIILVDSSPFVDRGSLEKWEMLRTACMILKEIEDQIKVATKVGRRSLADKAIEKVIPNKCDRALLLSNLLTVDKEDKLWKLNLNAIINNPGFVADYPELFFANASPYHGPVLFIGGENSKNLKKSDEGKIKSFFPNSEFLWMSNTGQWLHIEKHNELMKKIVSYLEA